jgi:hypothetical protein
MKRWRIYYHIVALDHRGYIRIHSCDHRFAVDLARITLQILHNREDVVVFYW